MTDTASHCNLLNEEGVVSHFNHRASFLHIWIHINFAHHFLQKQIPLQVTQCHQCHLNPQNIYALKKANFCLVWMQQCYHHHGSLWQKAALGLPGRKSLHIYYSVPRQSFISTPSMQTSSITKEQQQHFNLLPLRAKVINQGCFNKMGKCGKKKSVISEEKFENKF